MRFVAFHAALQLGHGYSQICAEAVVPVVTARPWLPAKGVEHRAVGSEYKAVFLICEVVITNEQGFGRIGEVADVKGVPSLKGLHNL